MNDVSVYIDKISIQGLYGKYDLEWNLNRNVNILVGINGSGKTTLFNIIDYLFTCNFKKLKQYNIKVARVKFNDDSNNTALVYSNESDIKFVIKPQKFILYSKINTFDVPSSARGKDKTYLDDKLEKLLFKKENENSFTFLDYRLTNLANQHNDTNSILKYQNKIEVFFNLINTFFIETDKKIEIDERTNSIKLVNHNTQTEISIKQLSAGEKQLLILLFSVFLQDEQSSILIMDEPEISMHIRWQQILIDTLIKLNPNVQLILSTHSPSVFGKGWSGHISRMEQLYLR